MGILASALSPEHLIESFGLVGIALVVFAETGLLIGFFLPGDSLLFTAGAAAAGALATLHVGFHLWALMLIVVTAAIVGDQVGYLVGRKVGPALADRPDSRLFKQAHLTRTQQFFEHHGPRAIVLARFVPVVRTFCPVVAGVGDMEYSTFVRYNVIGGAVWGAGVVLLGYWFGQIGFIADHLEMAILGIVAVSLLPIAVEVWRHRRLRKTPA